MKTKLFFLSFICFFAFQFLSAEEPVGFWKTFNDKTGKDESIIAIYKYGDKYYGRIIASYNAQGKLDDTIYSPKGRAKGVEGHPFYSGLDIIWNLQFNGSKYVKGKILDPRKGKIYDAEMWPQNGKLYVRGKILFFGENRVWTPAKDEDFPAGFSKPDLTKLVPSIPLPQK